MGIIESIQIFVNLLIILVIIIAIINDGRDFNFNIDSSSTIYPTVCVYVAYNRR